MTTQGLLERIGAIESTSELGSANVPGRLELRRAWPRGDWLALEYAGAGGRRVAAQWRPDRNELDRIAGETAEHAVGAPPSLVPTAGGELVLLQPAGADRRLPRLATLVDRPGAELIAHRPEQRAVVRIRGSAGDLYAKVLPRERAADARRGLTSVRRLAGGRFSVPEPAAGDSAPDILVTEPLPGESLHDLLAQPRGAVVGRAVGRALRHLHDAAADDLSPHSEMDERAVLARWTDRLARYSAPVAAAVTERMTSVRDALAAGPHGAEGPVHRDLHDGQVLVDPEGRIGLLDLDTLARGEGALDLANLLVHLELRVLQGSADRRSAEVVAAAILQGYRPEPEVGPRLLAYADATRLRLVAVYAFRPPCRAVLARLLTSVGAPLPGTSGRARTPRGLVSGRGDAPSREAARLTSAR